MNKLKWPAVLALLCLAKTIFAGSPVALSVNPAAQGVAISPDFSGLSYEMALMDPAADGGRYFTPKNKALVSMFRTLGVKSLRVGGNTADRFTVKEPDTADIDQFFAFAEAAGVKVIYTLRLNGGDCAKAAQTARYVMDHYGSLVTAFTIGNEPDKQFQNYPEYREQFRKYLQAITSNVPDAVFCGPSVMQKNVAWTGNFAADFAGDKHVVLMTQHEYPAGSGRMITNSLAGCEKLLSPNLTKVYDRFYNVFVPMTIASHKRYRLEEANSYSNGGAASVSDAYASALWALDYMYWWASHGADGINFHTGGYAGPQAPSNHMKYTVLWNAPDGFAAQPVAYALKAFDLGAHGQLVPVTVASNVDDLNVTAYAAISPDNLLHVTLINKESIASHAARITLTIGNSIHDAQAIFLNAANGDVTEKSRITLGGAAITHDGNWAGVWSPETCTNGRIELTLPAASAAVLRLAISPATFPGKPSVPGKFSAATLHTE